jgi:hypothetical protein
VESVIAALCHDIPASGTTSLAGSFNVITFAAIPARRTFWCYFQLRLELDEEDEAVAVSILMTAPDGTRTSVVRRAMQTPVRKLRGATAEWALRCQTTQMFEAFGSYEFALHVNGKQVSARALSVEVEG